MAVEQQPGASGLSIVIPHYGDPALAAALVHRLRSQTTEIPLQIIVSDDASPTAYPAQDGVDVVRRERNGGFGSAVNTGAALASHPLLLILNSDLEIDDRFIDDLLDAAQPWMPAIVSPATRMPSGRRVHVGRRFPTIATQVFAELTPLARWRRTPLWHQLAGHHPGTDSSDIVLCDWLLGAVLLLPTDLFRELGGFDERFHMNSEEVDLQRRARDLGVPSVYVGTVEALHDGGGSSDDGRRDTWLLEGQWRYAEKWHGRGRAQTLQAAHLAVATMNYGWNLMRSALGRSANATEVFSRRRRAVRSASSAA